MTLRIIRPAYTTVLAAAAKLIASNVAEADHMEWIADYTFAAGQRCIVAADHLIYESTVAGNANNPPAANLAGVTPKWRVVSATNKFRMFDAKNNTQTAQAELIDVTLAPGKADSIYLGELDAKEVLVTQVNGGVTVLDKTYSLTRNTSFSWSDYLNEPIVRKTELYLRDLIPYANSTVRVRILAPGAIAKCGILAVGPSRYIGDVQWKPRIRQVDYSGNETNVFGDIELMKRIAVDQISVELFVRNPMVDEVVRLMKEYTSVPMVYAYEGGETGDFDSLTAFGIKRDFEVVIDSRAGSFCNLDVLQIT